MKNVAGSRPKALAATNKHRALAAPSVPRGAQPAPLLLRRENQNFNQPPSLPSQQLSDDPYAFRPSEYTDHASPEKEEELEEDGLLEDAFVSPSSSEGNGEGDDDEEEEDNSEEDFDKEEEEEIDDSASEWEASSESDDPEVEEYMPAAAHAEKKVVTMVRNKTAKKFATATTTTTSTTHTNTTTKKKNTSISGPDSSFGIYLSDRMTNTANTGGATTSKLTNQQQQKPKTNAPAPVNAPTAVAPATAPAEIQIKKKKKKLTFADQASLPLMIPKSVAREPAGTAILIELPQGVELAGASGVVGRILKGRSGGGEGGKDGASGGVSNRSGIILDLMGIQYSTEVVQLPTSLAVAHLTGGTLIVDSILSTAVRAAAVPGQIHQGNSTNGNESVYSMEFDSDQSDYEDDTFDTNLTASGTATGSKKKAKGGAGKKSVRAARGGVKKPQKTIKKRGNASKPKGAARKKK